MEYVALANVVELIEIPRGGDHLRCSLVGTKLVIEGEARDLFTVLSALLGVSIIINFEFITIPL